MPVASAAPEMPSSGKGPGPKMSRGSRMMLAMHPARRAAMVIFIRPTAWKSFSNESPSMMITEKEKAMPEY